MTQKPLKRIAVTGGAGQIAYSLLFRLASGEALGNDQPIALHVLEIKEALPALEGVKMELEDAAFPLLKEIIIGSDPNVVFRDVDLALLVGAKPRGPGMERRDLLLENGKIFSEQGKALNKVANRKVKVLVVGNPCNTNCLIALQNAKDLPRANFHAMTRLDQNRATFQLAQKAGVNISDVKQVAIWGNHSTTMVPDFVNATIHNKPLLNVIPDRSWLEGEFLSSVQKRGAAIIEKRGKSSAASAASAIIDAVKDLVTPTPQGSWFSSAILSNGNPYGIAENLIFSFPCRLTLEGTVEIVPNLVLDNFLKERLKLTEKELLEERETAQINTASMER